MDHLVQGIRDGALALIPTDTGFCFVGDPSSASTLKAFLRLRAAHPRHKPFSLLVPGIASLSEFATITTPQYRILKKLLPGPYTVILAKNRRTPEAATGQKRDRVGIRLPNMPWLNGLLGALDAPLLVTSVTDAEELRMGDYYDGEASSPDAWWAYGEEILKLHGHEIGYFVDPHEPQPMRVSTIFDLTEEPPIMLRDGGWDLGDLTFDFERKS
jgi:tRNA threonylcarbamoyl adenosine modification protein (Sua5/YciO/YrdC/YwlC family)